MANERVVSIDILRGLTMMLMIFVNDLASVHGLPWWNYHLPASANGMTYVDMVFPTFLFIVGLSLPLAIEKRLKAGASLGQLWTHILGRTAGLLVLGIALANAEKCTSMSARFMGVSGAAEWDFVLANEPAVPVCGVGGADCAVRDFSANRFAFSSAVARFFLLGNSRDYRLDLSGGLLGVFADAAMEMGNSGLAGGICGL